MSHGYLLALFIAFGIAAGGEHKAAGAGVQKLHPAFGKRAVFHRKHYLKKVAVHQRQHRLGFGVSEAAVVFDDLRAVRRQHKAEIEAALKGPVFFVHSGNGREDYLLHRPQLHLFGIIGIRCDCAHAAGVQSYIPIADALMVHGRRHGNDGLSVGKGQHGHLRPGEEFLDNDAFAALSEPAVKHHFPYGVLRPVIAFCYYHALAKRKAVRLDDDRKPLSPCIGNGLVAVRKGLVRCGRNAVFLHQLLGKGLAALDDSGAPGRPEARNAHLPEPVGQSHCQRIVGNDGGKIYRVRFGKPDYAFYIRCRNGDAFRILRNAAVSGEGVDPAAHGAFLQRLDYGVFTAAGADE